MKNKYKMLIGKPETKAGLHRSWSRSDDNAKMNIEEIRCEGVGVIQLAQNSIQGRGFVSTVMSVLEFVDQASDYQPLMMMAAPLNSLIYFPSVKKIGGPAR
jgi:hypothetical protein